MKTPCRVGLVCRHGLSTPSAGVRKPPDFIPSQPTAYPHPASRDWRALQRWGRCTPWPPRRAGATCSGKTTPPGARAQQRSSHASVYGRSINRARACVQQPARRVVWASSRRWCANELARACKQVPRVREDARCRHRSLVRRHERPFPQHTTLPLLDRFAGSSAMVSPAARSPAWTATTRRRPTLRQKMRSRLPQRRRRRRKSARSSQRRARSSVSPKCAVRHQPLTRARRARSCS